MSSSKFEPASETILSVREITLSIKKHLEQAFSDLWIEGEISNFKRHHASGHCYFTLKDAEAQLQCVMWNGVANRLFFTPRDGLQVRAFGSLSVYEPRGVYQLVVRFMKPAGEGALQQAFEALKKQLQAEGLFDTAHKKPIPYIPEIIGIITSGSGAALHDMLSIIERRFPAVKVILCPVQVQGAEAASEIATAIRAFNRWAQHAPNEAPDVLIVGRGGGSIEDLWAFNEEEVARAIFESNIPIISAVGHEVDFSIADFVADRRAATPSMAAELVVPDKQEIEQWITGLWNHMGNTLRQQIHEQTQHIQHIVASYAFNEPRKRVEQLAQRTDELIFRLQQNMQRYLEQTQHRVASLTRHLHLLDPSAPLKRGYTRIEKEGETITSAKALSPQDKITIHFQDGTRQARIIE